MSETTAHATRPESATSIRLPATILGVGLGGFVDGIVLHQVLQWHHMLSSTGSDRSASASTRWTPCPGCR